MAVVGGLAVDGAKEVELFDDVGGFETEGFKDGALEFFLVNFAGAEGVHSHGNRFRVADGVGKLDFGAIGESGGHDIFCHPTPHVGRAAIHFARVFAAKGSAAVTAHAAIAVHDDFAPGEAGVALRAANDEVARGIDEKFGFFGEKLRRK